MISHDPAFCFIDRLLDPAQLGVTDTPAGARLHPSQINVNAGQYQSPYTLAFDFDWATLTHGLEKPPFAHWREQGREPAFARGPHDWFAPSAYARAHAHPAHGPLPRHYPPSRPPAGVERHRHDAWRAQRLLAVAAAMVGYGWRQHLTPDWNPDAAWFARFGLPADPGQGVSGGAYVAWLYNYALGIQLELDVAAQSRARHVHAPTVGRLTIQRVADARCSYRQLRQQLRPGDVLYLAEGYARQDIRRRLDADDPPPASHALLWLGEVGQAPAGAPLVSDSHAANWLRDTYGSFIPSGVQLRPFYDTAPGSDLRRCCPPGAQSAYFEQFLWASRLLPDVVESEPVGIVEEWLEVATFAG